MASPTSWEFYKEVETKILWVNICAQDLERVSIKKYLRKEGAKNWPLLVKLFQRNTIKILL